MVVRVGGSCSRPESAGGADARFRQSRKNRLHEFFYGSKAVVSTKLAVISVIDWEAAPKLAAPQSSFKLQFARLLPKRHLVQSPGSELCSQSWSDQVAVGPLVDS